MAHDLGKVPATPLLVARNLRRTEWWAEPPGQPGRVRSRQVGVDTPNPIRWIELSGRLDRCLQVTG